ncbi:TonB-dependent receptor [Sphingomonas abietis]|uniref:TonB-dependent receptor n=1 Tax=Sphingomonas abietis TaxID=3012344 RepID=A0ABY7NHX3_9SPHN|nr:TonB-dependent receptor [Sphingomonas abietis]WBO21113.1 TonB-dependent receptor [Sphingomonas abietis]
MRGFWASGGLLLAALPAPSIAQATTAAPPAASATPPPKAGPPEPAPFGEIVVTATRTEQSISKVPISISAFNQQALDLKGAKTLADVARFTPGLQFDNGSNQIAIRGISSNAGAGTTGIYIDDTPIQIRNLGFDSDDTLPAIFDLDRVEVLRGPQGTLFGAGSEGGTVRYITPQPGLDQYTSYSRAEVSSTAHGGMSWEVGSAIGGPIVDDKLGFRISAYHRHDSGWIDKTDYDGNVLDKNTNYANVTVIRGALTWAPAENFKITPSVQYQQRLTADDDFYVEGQSDPGRGVFKDSSPEYRRNPDHFVLPALKLDWKADAFEVVSNSSYFKRRNVSGYDGTVYDLSYYQTLDGRLPDANGDTPPLLTAKGIDPSVDYYLSPSVVTNKQRIFTQEVRIQSTNPGAPITWVAGIFYQDQHQLSREELVDPKGNQLFEQLFGMSLEDYFGAAADNDGPLPLYDGRDSYINQSKSREKQIAGFADVTWHITPTLSVTGGGRFEKVTYSFVNFADGPQNYGRTDASGHTSSTPFLPKANISWQIDRDDLLYGTYSRGFRPGGANAPVPYDACSDDFDGLGIKGAPSSYKSDTVDSFEVGTKNKLFDRKLSIEASAFTIQWKGIQQFVTLPECAIMYIDNLGKARARGFDIQLTGSPLPGVTLDMAMGYTDSRYTKTAQYESPTSILAVKGDSLGGAPWTVSLGAQYDFPAFGERGYARVDYQYASRSKRTKEMDPNAIASYDPGIVSSDATHFVGLRAGALVGGMNISLFVDNLLDSAPLLDRTHQGIDTLLYTDRTWRPRTVGLTASYRM